MTRRRTSAATRSSATRRRPPPRMRIWNEINLPNLVENVLPTKHRATLVLQKSADHRRRGAAAQAVTRRMPRSTRWANAVRSWRSPTPRRPSSALSSSVCPHHRASPSAFSPSAMRIPNARGARSGGGGPSRTAGSSACGMSAPAAPGSPRTLTPGASRCCSTGRTCRRSPSRDIVSRGGLALDSVAGKTPENPRTHGFNLVEVEGRVRASSRGTASGSTPPPLARHAYGRSRRCG